MPFLSVPEATWRKYQNFLDKDGRLTRNVAWIRLYVGLLNVYGDDGTKNEIRDLSDPAWRLLLSLWLLAGRWENKIPDDPQWIEKETGAKCRQHLQVLITEGFITKRNASVTEALQECNGSVTLDIDKDQDRDQDNKELLPGAEQGSDAGQHVDIFLSGFPMLDGSLQDVTRAQYDNFNAAYGKAIAVDFELRKAKSWLETNPKGHKKNLGRFLNNWLSTAVEKHPGRGINDKQKPQFTSGSRPEDGTTFG